MEAAGGCGLVLGAGCVEGAGAGVGTAGTVGAEGRGVALTAGASVRSNLFSWLAALLDTRQLEGALWVAHSQGVTAGGPSYPGAEGPSGCEGVLARAGLEAVTASSVTWAEPEPGLTVATLLACSVWGMKKGEGTEDVITL